MYLKIKINLDNAAFADDQEGELRRVLTRIPLDSHEAMPGEPWSIHDSNGNMVGHAVVQEAD